MGLRGGGADGESRFEAYVDGLSRAVRHADRAAPLRAYCLGLMPPGDRKSVEPMAARVEPARVQAAHQSLHHFVAKHTYRSVIFAFRAELGLPDPDPADMALEDYPNQPCPGEK